MSGPYCPKTSNDTAPLAELSYQFDRPFGMDSTASDQVLGLVPTPLPTATADTVRWWQEEQAGPGSRAAA